MRFLGLMLLGAGLVLAVNTASAKKENEELSQQVQQIKKDWQEKDDTFNATLEKAYGYVIFPEVGKGGFIVGAAHGTGEVYEKGKLIGHAKLTQTTVGAQVGGETYAEVILFKNKKALDRFKNSRFEGAAGATAIGGKKGAVFVSWTRVVVSDSSLVPPPGDVSRRLAVFVLPTFRLKGTIAAMNAGKWAVLAVGVVTLVFVWPLSPSGSR